MLQIQIWKKVVIEILERQPNQWTIMCVYWMKSSRELVLNFNGKILFELYGTFDSIKPDNSSLVRLSLENLYHNLFSDLDLEHPDRFYRDFSIWTVLPYMNYEIVKSWKGWIERFAFIFIGWINWRYCDGFRWLYWTSTNKLLLLRKYPGNNQNLKDVFNYYFKYLLSTGSVSKQDKTKRLATWTVKQLKKIQRNVNGH